jgi:hypothetical protein
MQPTLFPCEPDRMVASRTLRTFRIQASGATAAHTSAVFEMSAFVSLHRSRHGDLPSRASVSAPRPRELRARCDRFRRDRSGLNRRHVRQRSTSITSTLRLCPIPGSAVRIGDAHRAFPSSQIRRASTRSKTCTARTCVQHHSHTMNYSTLRNRATGLCSRKPLLPRSCCSF